MQLSQTELFPSQKCGHLAAVFFPAYTYCENTAGFAGHHGRLLRIRLCLLASYATAQPHYTCHRPRKATRAIVGAHLICEWLTTSGLSIAARSPIARTSCVDPPQALMAALKPECPETACRWVLMIWVSKGPGHNHVQRKNPGAG